MEVSKVLKKKYEYRRKRRRRMCWKEMEDPIYSEY